MLPSLFADLTRGLYALATVTIVAYAVVIALAVAQRLNHTTRAVVLTLDLLAVSGALLWFLGPIGGAVAWYVATLAFCGLVLGARYIVWAFVLAALLWAAIIASSAAGLTPWSTDVASDAIHGANAVAAALLVAVGTHQLLRSMHRAYRSQRSLRRTLHRRNRHLDEANNALRRQAQWREHLLRELHHRVKNNLQLLTSLSRLKYGEAPHGSAIDALHRRTHCLARLLDLHYESGIEDDVSLAAILQTVIESLTGEERGGDVLIEVAEDALPLTFGIEESTTAALLLCEVLEPWMQELNGSTATLRYRVDRDRACELQLTPVMSAEANEVAHALAEQLGVSLLLDAERGICLSPVDPTTSE